MAPDFDKLKPEVVLRIIKCDCKVPRFYLKSQYYTLVAVIFIVSLNALQPLALSKQANIRAV